MCLGAGCRVTGSVTSILLPMWILSTISGSTRRIDLVVMLINLQVFEMLSDAHGLQSDTH